MKKLLTLLVVSLVLFTNMAFANGGSAVIPAIRFVNISSTNRSVPIMIVSNITDSPITIRVLFYKEDGLLVSDDNSQISGIIQTDGGTISNYEESGTNFSVRFRLDPHNTARIQLVGDSTPHNGHGLIRWSQNNGDNVVGLVAHMHTVWQDSVTGGVMGTSINNGLPF